MPWGSAQLEDLTGGIEVMFFPPTYSAFGADVIDDTVGTGHRQGRDPGRPYFRPIANDLAVPDFSNAQVNRPLAIVSLPTRQCTIDKVSALKQVLAQHPGTSQVHLRLLSGDRVTTLELDAVTAGDAVSGADGRPQGAAGSGASGQLACTSMRPAAHSSRNVRPAAHSGMTMGNQARANDTECPVLIAMSLRRAGD